MNPAIREAIEAADEACPCRHADGILLDTRDPHMCEKVCACVIGSTSMMPAPACLWPGHAAIRNLARMVLEEAAKAADGAYKSVAGYAGTSNAGRTIRTLMMPEEVKQT